MSLAVLLAAGCAAGAPAKGAQPHIMFMLVDDLGWNDMEWHDEFGQIQSPKLNALREEGVTLDRYYVYRFCSPSRSTFQSGRYPWHVGQQTTQNLNPMPGVACGIDLKYKFMGDVMKSAGYTTWALGKWHLGFLSNDYTPTYRGYDRYVGYYSGAEQHFSHEKNGMGHNLYDLANNTGKEVAPCLGAVGNASATYSSYLFGNETLRLLDAHDPADPLYVYLAWNNVHDPCQAPQNYIEPHQGIKDSSRRSLAAMVSALDDQLTAVVDKLKAKGMWENTLLVFSSDNGGNLGGSGSNYPLRGGKYTFWEGGVRVQGFVAGGLIPAHLRGSTYDGYVHAADWYTTFASLAGASVEGTGPVAADGLDMTEALLANATSPREEVVLQIVSNSTGNLHALPPADYCEDVKGTDAYYHCVPPSTHVLDDAVDVPEEGAASGLSCGVLIQGRFKLLWGYPGWSKTEWNGWLKPLTGEGPEVEARPPPPGAPCNLTAPCLFDIRSDPTEHHDVAAAHPHVVKRMQARVLELLQGEVTLAASGLCPTSAGTRPDQRMVDKALPLGFWVPWLSSP